MELTPTGRRSSFADVSYLAYGAHARKERSLTHGRAHARSRRASEHRVPISAISKLRPAGSGSSFSADQWCVCVCVCVCVCARARFTQAAQRH